jgi:hypothetical protein
VAHHRVLGGLLVVIGGVLVIPTLALLAMMVLPGANLVVVAPGVPLVVGAATILGVVSMAGGAALLRRPPEPLP